MMKPIGCSASPLADRGPFKERTLMRCNSQSGFQCRNLQRAVDSPCRRAGSRTIAALIMTISVTALSLAGCETETTTEAARRNKEIFLSDLRNADPNVRYEAVGNARLIDPTVIVRLGILSGSVDRGVAKAARDSLDRIVHRAASPQCRF